jgi:hypothetical protein
MKLDNKYILNLLILLQGLILIVLSEIFDYNNEYLIFVKIFLFIYFIISVYLIKIINRCNIIKKEESEDKFDTFDCTKFDQDYKQRT